MDFALHGLPLPIRIRAEVPMTDDELLEFCSKNDSVQVEREEDGAILVMSPSGSETSESNSELTAELVLWNRQVGHGKVFDSNGGFTLPDSSVRAADAAWLSAPKWEQLSPYDRKRFAPVCPEFVVELRSPSDCLPDIQQKMEMWIRNGVQLGWLIDPQEKAVTIYRPGQAPERLDAVSQVSGEGPVAGFVLPLNRIFI